MSAADGGALRGLRVLELGSLLAGPFAGQMLAAFGAEVIKIEPPGLGDPIRRWRKLEGGTSLWWRSLARNKKCITCDLRQPAGRDLVRRLLASGIDIVVENFRPGRMEKWGLGPDDLKAIDPRIITVRVSGYGQSGPYKDRPGFANVAESFGGLRYVTGYPDRPPVRTGASLGDSLAGLHAAFGALTAVYAREQAEGTQRGRGQVVDVALYESVMNVMESLVPEYDRLGHVRERTGSALPGIAPSGTYRCRDGGFIALGANSDSLYDKLMRAIGRDDLADDPALAHNDGRATQSARLDEAIQAWMATRDQADALKILVDADIPAGAIQSVAALVADPHVQARGMVERVTLPDGSTLGLSKVVPALSDTPAATHWAGPELGAHNEEVYGALGLSDAELAQLRTDGVI